jgi:hypothetical protein
MNAWNTERYLFLAVILTNLLILFPDFVRIPSYLFLFNIVPGWIFLKFYLRIKIDNIRMTILSISLSIIIGSLLFLIQAIILGSLSPLFSLFFFDIFVLLGIFLSRYREIYAYKGLLISRASLLFLLALGAFNLIAHSVYLLLIIQFQLDKIIFISNPSDYFLYISLIEESRKAMPPQWPEFSGTPLTYPWLFIIFYSGISELTTLNSFFLAIIMNGIMSTALGLLVFLFCTDNFKNELIGAISAFFFSFGTEATWLLQLVLGTPPFWYYLPPRIPSPGIAFCSSLGIDQFMKGFMHCPAYIIAILFLFFLNLFNEEQKKRYLITSIVLFMMFPFYHTLIYVVVLIVLLIFAFYLLIRREIKHAALMFVIGVLSFLPLFLYWQMFAPYLLQIGSSQPGRFIGIKFLYGEFVPFQSLSAILSYMGFVLILTIVGFMFSIKTNRFLDRFLVLWLLVISTLIFFTDFRVGNYYYYWAFSIPAIFYAGKGLAKIFSLQWFSYKWTKYVVLLFLCVVCLIPTIQLFSTAINSPAYLTLHRDELDAYQWIRDNTPENSLFLAAPSNGSYPPSPITSFSGRRIVLGNEFHVEPYKLNYERRYQDVRVMYTSPNISEAINLMNNFDVDYIFVSIREHESFGKENLIKFADNPQHFTLVFKNSHCDIYSLS